METASTEVTSIRRRNNVEKSTWKTHRYFVDFESRIHVEISMSNRCHNFHVHSPFKIDVISTNFPLGIATSNRWRIDEDVSIGIFHFTDRLFECQTSHYKQILENYRETGKTRLDAVLYSVLPMAKICAEYINFIKVAVSFKSLI